MNFAVTTIVAVLMCTWEPVGIGGGGGVFTPCISPHDPSLMFVSCDMGGLYRSADNGKTWRMCDGSQVRKVNTPAVFHPTDPNVIFIGARGGIRKSTDKGLTWQNVAGQWNLDNPDVPTAIAINPQNPNHLLACFNTWLGQTGFFLVQSTDAGKTWQLRPDWTSRDKRITDIYFAPKPLTDPLVLVATRSGFYRSKGADGPFVEKNQGLPDTNIQHCVAAWTPKTDRSIIFLTLPAKIVDGKYVGGVYRSTDLGAWTPALNGLDTLPSGNRLPQYTFLAMSPTNTQVAYVTCNGANSDSPEHCSTVYRTADGGNSWSRVLYGVPAWPKCNVEPDWLTVEMTWWWGGNAEGFGCSPTNPDDVIFTDEGRGIRTIDGGKHWFPISSRKEGKDNWSGQGLEVTTCYQYYFDPHDPNRTYITYTDIGLTRSLDRGKSWIHAARRVPWGGNCYELAFDPDRPGVVFGAWSGPHDLVHWKMINGGTVRGGGGVTKSSDYAETWAVCGRESLPQAPATSITLDPSSPKDSRTLYVGLLGKGVFKSTDDGNTWIAKNKGLGSPENMNVWRLDRHTDGTLLCGISLQYRDGKPVPGALYRSADGAESWQLVNTTQPLPYIWGVRMDPRNSNVIYVACLNVPPAGFPAAGSSVPWPKAQGGGLFKSSDTGKTWTRILDQPYCWDVSFDPKNPDVVYVGTFVGGVFRSPDAGASWKQLAGLPFVNAHHVTVDPNDSKSIYVTSFGGGVWKGTLP